MYVANINEAKANISQLIKRALAGDEVIIARSNEHLVRLVPVVHDVSPRLGGFWAGQIQYNSDASTDAAIAQQFIDSPLFPQADE